MGYARNTTHATRTDAQPEECEHPGLCQFLGFGFPEAGLIIAAIIDKAPGVKQALLGAVLRYAIIVVLVLVM